MRVKITSSRPVPASLRYLVSRLVRGQGPAVPVERQQIPYWQERGWTRKGNTYTAQIRLLKNGCLVFALCDLYRFGR